jgi:hypothetical protein
MQSTIDEIVGQFYSGRKKSAARACKVYKESIFSEHAGGPKDFEFCGTIIPNHRLEPGSDIADRLDGYVSDERLKALSKGAKSTEAEKQEYRRRVIAEVEGGTADADVIPGYFVRRLRHSDGREVFAVETVSGYSFSGVENTVPRALFVRRRRPEESLNLGTRCKFLANHWR